MIKLTPGEHERDVWRSTMAATAIIDGRDPSIDYAAILASLEAAVTVVLLSVMNHPARAEFMLRKGLVPGIEKRLASIAATPPGELQ